jgi:ubiquinone/menaquinone biosynthesis C-methylase UbiE
MNSKVGEVDPVDVETSRIRSVYEGRDLRGARHPAIAEAYKLVNEERLRLTRRIVRETTDKPYARILDVGCGSGFDLAQWLSAGWPAAALAGVDLIPERVEQAISACPGVDVRLTDGTVLPFADNSFDVATAVTVFSSILDRTARRALMAEMVRVVRAGGTVLVYDFVVRKPTNRDVLAMTLWELRDLNELPLTSIRLTPLLHALAAGTLLGRVGIWIARRFAPRTHRLTAWRVPAQGAQSAP